MADQRAPAPMHPSAGSDEARGARWLSLGPASRELGVDPDTLRRWADEGRVDAWTTPGGHRRFDRRAVERLARERRPGAPARALADLGASPERFARVYRARYGAEGTHARVASAPRDDTEREAYRQDGRRLIAALVAYLDADPADSTARSRAEAEATAIVDGHGTRSAAGGVSLTQAVELFVHARQPFLAEIAGLGRRRSLDSVRLASLYGDASALLDRLLLRFIGAHQRHPAPDGAPRSTTAAAPDGPEAPDAAAPDASGAAAPAKA